jgi:GTP-binding protein Era
MPETPHRCGFVTLIGRPNVGKSTLLNRVLGEKLAAVSSRPQTTRNRIPGVLTLPDAQIVFVDTPGIHHAKSALNRYMVDVAEEAMRTNDAVALLIEAGVGPDMKVGISDVDRGILRQLADVSRPVFLVINKIDRIAKPTLLPIIDAWRQEFEFAHIIPLSALTGEGVDAFVDELVKVLPEGPPLYPADIITDLPERFIAAELIREKLFLELEKELPYSVAVTIDRWQERAHENLVVIEAVIHVERDSQKAIVIGRGGAMIKQVGQTARHDLERLLGTRVHLNLFVRVERGWTRTPDGLRKLGYE